VPKLIFYQGDERSVDLAIEALLNEAGPPDTEDGYTGLQQFISEKDFTRGFVRIIPVPELAFGVSEVAFRRRGKAYVCGS
jgi:hypothetical protein